MKNPGHGHAGGPLSSGGDGVEVGLLQGPLVIVEAVSSQPGCFDGRLHAEHAELTKIDGLHPQDKSDGAPASSETDGPSRLRKPPIGSRWKLRVACIQSAQRRNLWEARGWQLATIFPRTLRRPSRCNGIRACLAFSRQPGRLVCCHQHSRGGGGTGDQPHTVCLIVRTEQALAGAEYERMNHE